MARLYSFALLVSVATAAASFAGVSRMQPRLAHRAIAVTMAADEPQVSRSKEYLEEAENEEEQGFNDEIAAERDALAGDQAQLGPSHPHTLDSIYNLARLHQAEGDVAKALPLFQQELEGCAALYGPAHQETATSARNLRALYLQVGQEANAAELTRRFELAEEIS